MSSLLLLNGSPRGAGSNSMRILSRVERGWRAHAGTGATVETLHLAKRSQFDRAVEAYAEADTVLIGMPLYADAMPSLVKEYFEQLAPYVGRTGNPRMAFVAQSGFSEGLHSRGLERYFERLAERLGAPYGGTIVRGGGESLRSMPDEASKKLWASLVALGESLAREGRFDPELLASVVGIERFSPLTAAVLGVALKWPLPAIMWPELKKNGAWDRRDARPYVESAGQRGAR
jgi:hypothetical protein